MFATLADTAAPHPWSDADEDRLHEAILSATEAARLELIACSLTDDTIPAGLDEIEPGPMLAALLAQIDVDRVDGFDRVVVLRAHARMVAHYQAHVYADIASVTDFLGDAMRNAHEGTRAAAAEIRLALRLTRRATETEVAMALDLKQRLPNVWEMLVAGDIDGRRARCIAHTTSHLAEGPARQVADAILPAAPELTTGQIAARVRRMCFEVNPAEATERYEEAIERRRVVVEQNPDGTGNLSAYDLPADRLAAIRARIHEIARSLKTSAEPRSMDQLRSDVLLDLLEDMPCDGAGRAGGVELRIGLDTLTGHSRASGELAGFGPVVADVARQVADRRHRGQWRWTVVDSSGAVIDSGVTRRRPTRTQRRRIEAERPRCVFPGCRMPAGGCDLDHITPYAEGGPTDHGNLAPLCRHDHVIRHLPGWGYQVEPDGSIPWRTGLGHAYTSGRPPPSAE